MSTLSLSAEKNCAQNSGAKRRDDINSLIMTNPVLEKQPEVVALFVKRHDRKRMGRTDRTARMSPACSVPSVPPIPLVSN
ncbi:hypothetical protein ACU4GH_20345 [Bradyrhizobium betae]